MIAIGVYKDNEIVERKRCADHHISNNGLDYYS